MRTLWLCTLAATLAACGSPPSEVVDDDFSTLAAEGEKSDLFSSSMKVLGTLAYGQSSAQAVAYANPPKYRAYKVTGHAGDYVEIWVRSVVGDPMAWLLDARFNVVAQNDNALPSTVDSHIVTNLPATGTYYIAFREKNLAKGTFSVELKGGKDFYACKSDSDCVSVDRGGCCSNGWHEAVSASQVAAYRASTKCAQARPICPLYMINDTRQPECNNGTKKCEMVAIANIACGGFILNQHHCPGGYDCRFHAVPDVPGSCQPTKK